MDFFEWFRQLLGDTGVNEFARLSGTSPAAVSRAKNGSDVATENLEAWSRTFGLTTRDALRFIYLGQEAELLQSLATISL